MEDFDLFTDEIQFTEPVYLNYLNKFLNEMPAVPNGPNYQSARKLKAEECLSADNHLECVFHLSESVSATLRFMAIYRDENTKIHENKLNKILTFIKSMNKVIDAHPVPKQNLLPTQKEHLNLMTKIEEEVTQTLNYFKLEEEEFHKKYLRFSDNNVDNFVKILSEMPKEWTIIQLTAPHNPNENLKPLDEYRTEIQSLFVSVLSNDYLDGSGLTPFTVRVPANVNKVGEKPLFVELYSLLEENYNTIDNAQKLNNKKLVRNYWNRREEVDLRMKSVINVMDKEFLGGWGCLLTGKLVDTSWKEKVMKLVDNVISDWGFIRLTKKQHILLYNLIETCPVLNSNQIKTCIRRILTEQGNPEDLRTVLDKSCSTCRGEFQLPSDLCSKCLSKCFESVHKFTLVDGVKAFSQAARTVREESEWSGLKKAERHPVILIVDEMLDTFPWETLPIINQHPVSRIENIHFLYYLYKLHEENIVDGYFEAKCDVGRYVINPEKNLDRMERRMTSFVQYWCPNWSGYISEPPPAEEFVKCLTEADLYFYCGHGDGCRFANGAANGAGVEGARGTKAVVILSGCGSVRLSFPRGRGPPVGPHYHFHIAGCPVVVGMLWEVTDLEVDKVVSTLVSLYAPSTAAVPWHRVGKTQWADGVLDTSGAADPKPEPSHEPNLLRAIGRARGSSAYVMIASSVVARGLPVRMAH